MSLAVSARFDFIDAKGKTTFTKIRLPLGFNLSAYIEAIQSAAQLLADLSTIQITRASVCFGMDLSGATIKASPSGLSDRNNKGFFQFASIPGFKTSMRIPAISETKVVAGSDALDASDPDVAAFVSAMETGVVVTGGTIAATDLRGNDVSTLDYAREIFRKGK